MRLGRGNARPRITRDWLFDYQRRLAAYGTALVLSTPPLLHGQQQPFVERVEVARVPADGLLLPRLSRDRGRKAYSMEEALHLIGDALEPLPGAKAVVLVGLGFGWMGSGSLVMPGYDGARAALLAARAAVFSLDISQADSHTLAASLQTASDDTGGFYASTNLFPQRAIERVAQALVGHYVLFVEKPDTEPGMRRIAVRLTRERGTVFARAAYAE